MFQALLKEHWFKDIKTRRALQTLPLYARTRHPQGAVAGFLQQAAVGLQRLV